MSENKIDYEIVQIKLDGRMVWFYFDPLGKLAFKCPTCTTHLYYLPGTIRYLPDRRHGLLNCLIVLGTDEQYAIIDHYVKKYNALKRK